MSNLRTIYSPVGEKFEVSEPNFLDLTRHAGWTETRPHPDDAAKAAETAPASPAAAPEAPVATPPAAETTPAPAAAPEAPAETVPPVAKTEPNHFADMDREAVKAHINETFPEAAIDGRSGRDALVAQAIDLAKA